LFDNNEKDVLGYKKKTIFLLFRALKYNEQINISQPFPVEILLPNKNVSLPPYLFFKNISR
jgi:hypothetical protein